VYHRNERLEVDKWVQKVRVRLITNKPFPRAKGYYAEMDYDTVSTSWIYSNIIVLVFPLHCRFYVFWRIFREILKARVVTVMPEGKMWPSSHVGQR
jgi:hypothetical protein